MHGIVAHMFFNTYEKIHQFLSSKRDAYKRKLVPFFCLTVYLCQISSKFCTPKIIEISYF